MCTESWHLYKLGNVRESRITFITRVIIRNFAKTSIIVNNFALVQLDFAETDYKCFDLHYLILGHTV